MKIYFGFVNFQSEIVICKVKKIDVLCISIEMQRIVTCGLIFIKCQNVQNIFFQYLLHNARSTTGLGPHSKI